MPTVTLVVGADGKLQGLTEADGRGWDRFKRKCVGLAAESCLSFTWKEPRSGPFHRRFFAMLGAAFEAQERFEDPDQFRAWLQIGAGFADFLPHPTRGLVALPKSIAYDKLEQAEFQAVAGRIWAFYRSEHALALLYPHLSPAQAWEMADAILEQFE